MKLRSLSISSFSYATISSSGISPPEKMFARDTYWDSLDLRFSLSPSPVTSSTLPWQLSTTSKNFSMSLILDTFIVNLLSKSFFYVGGLAEHHLSSKFSVQAEILYTQLGGKSQEEELYDLEEVLDKLNDLINAQNNNVKASYNK